MALWRRVALALLALLAVGSLGQNQPVFKPIDTNGPPTYVLQEDFYSVFESQKSVDVVIQKLGGRAGAVNYRSDAGTALKVDPDGLGDFFHRQGSTNLPAGNATATIRIELNDDPILRSPSPRTFTFSILASPDSGVFPSPSTAQISILDDDSPLTSTLAWKPPTEGPNIGRQNIGYLKIDLYPPEAEGKWRFPWELDWRSTGEKFGPLESGTYQVEFMPRDRYHPLDPVDIFVPAGTARDALVWQTNYVEVPATEHRFGSLRVNLIFSDDRSLTRGRWRLLDRSTDDWFASGTNLPGVLAGTHVIDFEEVKGYDTPRPRVITVQPGPGLTSVISGGYQASENPAKHQSLASSENVQSVPPYIFCGQLVTDAGFASGILVRPRVVLTAAHTLFRTGTTNSTLTARWFFERHKGSFEPHPLLAKGWYISTNYLNAIASEPKHDGLSPPSREHDIAAIYFKDDAGRGGYSGYLKGDLRPDEWLIKKYPTVFVGYPLNDTFSGQIHDESITSVQLNPFGFSNILFTNVFTTRELGGLPGSSGGPLCIVFPFNVIYYPAAIYLGQSGDQALFRVIDREAVNLIEQAEDSSYSGRNNTGGGVVRFESGPGGQQFGYQKLTVRVQPPTVVKAGAAWRLEDGVDFTFGELADADVVGGKTYTMGFISPSGWLSPTNFNINVPVDQDAELTITYDREPVRWIASATNLSISGPVGQVVNIESTSTLSPPVRWTNLSNVTLHLSPTVILSRPWPTNSARYYRANWQE